MLEVSRGRGNGSDMELADTETLASGRALLSQPVVNHIELASDGWRTKIHDVRFSSARAEKDSCFPRGYGVEQTVEISGRPSAVTAQGNVRSAPTSNSNSENGHFVALRRKRFVWSRIT